MINRTPNPITFKKFAGRLEKILKGARQACEKKIQLF